MKQPNLKEVEKRTYMSYHQDGLIDIFIGLYVILFATVTLLNNILDISTWFVIPAIFPALMVPIWLSIKKRVTMPRIGYVKFKTQGANKLTAIFIGLMVAGLATFLLFGFASTRSWALTLRNIIISNGMLFIGIGAFAISSLFAYTLGLKRLYSYGLLTLAFFSTGYVVKLPFEYLPLIIGLVIIIYGCILLAKFTRKYPLTQGENENVQQPI